MRKNVSHFLEVTICNHAISLIKDEHVDHWQSLEQVRVHLVIHELPQTAWCGNNDCWLVAQKPLLLLNRHASNECRNFNLIAVRDGYDCFNHVLYLDG